MKKYYVNIAIELVAIKEDIVTASGDNIIEDDWIE